MNNATNKTNEEAADLLEKHLDFFAGTTQWVFTLAIAALRSTPPAIGAAAMREACLEAVRKCNVIGERGTEGNWFGGVLAALEQAEADIRALPAPEVPEAVKKWCERWDGPGVAGSTSIDFALRDWTRKEYGL